MLRMRRLLGVALAVAAGALAGVVLEATRPSGARATGCSEVQLKQELDPEGRTRPVFPSRRVAFGQLPARNYAYAACLYSVGLAVPLRPEDGFTDLHFDSLRSAGSFFAYVYGQDDFHTQFLIASVDLRSGRYVHQVTFADRNGDAGVPDLVLKEDGAIAWIQTDSLGRSTVRKADSRSVQVPRHGHGARPFSLRLRGDRIYWRTGRIKRSALLR